MTTNGSVTNLDAARGRLLDDLRREGIPERVLDAFAKVSRERFVLPEARDLAYENRPLPIGYGQTISQPLMVAIMLLELAPQPTDRVLDIGTGSGYQAALLAELAASVVSVERIPALAEHATSVLAELGYASVRVHVVGEELGWPTEAPYDKIIVAAAAPRVPYALVDQLAAGGRLVIPVGERRQQYLMVVDKRPEGLRVSRRTPCGFVPLIGRNAFSEADGIEETL
jgi:protein-L-isoaspartate(D-aspartate) O-methyltransferase